jgi:hypothetical protein
MVVSGRGEREREREREREKDREKQRDRGETQRKSYLTCLTGNVVHSRNRCAPRVHGPPHSTLFHKQTSLLAQMPSLLSRCRSSVSRYESICCLDEDIGRNESKKRREDRETERDRATE